MDDIKDYLETCYVGARAMGNYEDQMRIARAIAAYESDQKFEIFIDVLTEKEKEFLKRVFKATNVILDEIRMSNDFVDFDQDDLYSLAGKLGIRELM